MQTGPGNVKIAPGCRLVIRCSKKFTALGLDNTRELKAILGPRAEGDRVLNRLVPLGIVWLKMQTSKTAHWSYEVTDRHQTHSPEQTPAEIPVQGQQISYFEEIRKLIRDEMSQQARESGQETFEEADDFDVGGEEPTSQYEISEMEEDAEYEPKKDPPKSPEGLPEKVPAGPTEDGNGPNDPEKLEHPNSPPIATPS